MRPISFMLLPSVVVVGGTDLVVEGFEVGGIVDKRIDWIAADDDEWVNIVVKPNDDDDKEAAADEIEMMDEDDGIIGTDELVESGWSINSVTTISLWQSSSLQKHHTVWDFSNEDTCRLILEQFLITGLPLMSKQELGAKYVKSRAMKETVSSFVMESSPKQYRP